MKNLLEYLLNRLVDYPEDVTVEESQDMDTSVYTIHVHQDDIGRVIGKGGSVINAIRTIAKVRAIKEKNRIKIVLADQD